MSDPSDADAGAGKKEEPARRLLRCERCGRREYADYGQIDQMIQPSGNRCGGVFLIDEPPVSSCPSAEAQRIIEITQRLHGWRDNCAKEGGDPDIVAIFDLHAADDVRWLLQRSEEAAETITAQARTRQKCSRCENPAICVGLYERSVGSPEFACDECCGHGCEDGKCVQLDRPDDVRAFLLALHQNIIEQTEELREAESALAAARQELERNEERILELRLDRDRLGFDLAAARLRATPQEADGVSLIAAERARQMSSEGWTSEHDDSHAQSELVSAAICYAEVGSGFDLEISARDGDRPTLWPFEPSWWNPSDDLVRNLVKAGALIAAEIDRLLRSTRSRTTDEETTDEAARIGETASLASRQHASTNEVES